MPEKLKTMDFNEIKSQIPDNVELIAVSKRKSNEHIINIYNKGQRIFAENHVQELVEKQKTLPNDIQWQMIGHLQTNKVKYIAPFVSLIQSVDSIKLLTEINKRALQNKRTIDCLLEIHIADEDSKFGIKIDEIDNFISTVLEAEFNNIRIVGFMGMATHTDDKQKIFGEFSKLNDVFITTKNKYFADKPYFKELSMGMSSDYKIAIEAGATMVRIGSLIFGKRD